MENLHAKKEKQGLLLRQKLSNPFGTGAAYQRDTAQP